MNLSIKSMLQGLLFSVVALVFFGCAKPPEQVYSHPKTGTAQLAGDISACQDMAQRFGLINMSPVHQYPMADMKDSFRRKRVFRFCMMKKGYERNGYIPVAVNETNTRIFVTQPVLAGGEASSVRIRFSSPVGGFEASDLTIENAELKNLRSSDSGRTWTATLVAAQDIDDTSNVISLDNSGVINRLSNKGTGITLSNNYQVYSRKPLITSVP